MNYVEISFDDDKTMLSTSSEKVILSMGVESLAQQEIKNDVPTAYETERLIMLIEDEIEKQSQNLSFNIRLSTNDSRIKKWLPFFDGTSVISVEMIEEKFNEVANMILGSPWDNRIFPDDKIEIVLLILIRELMHHLNIEYLEYREN